MAIYCKKDDKPKVIYRANGDTKDNIFTSKFSPIEVTVVPLENPNLKDETYAWNFSTNLNPRTTLAQLPFKAKGKLTAFRVTGIINTDTVNGIQNANYGAEFRDGNGTLISGSAVGYLNDPPTLSKILIRNPEKQYTDICRLTVKDMNGIVLFSASGKCPINFSVQCGKCPDGQHECESKIYPYYCCNSCADTAKQLNKLVDKYGKKL